MCYSRAERTSELSRTFGVSNIRCNWVYESYSEIAHIKRIQCFSECFMNIYQLRMRILTSLPVLKSRSLFNTTCWTPAPLYFFYASGLHWFPHGVCHLTSQIFHLFSLTSTYYILRPAEQVALFTDAYPSYFWAVLLMVFFKIIILTRK